jgi:large subunit ribosomal protein L23
VIEIKNIYRNDFRILLETFKYPILTDKASRLMGQNKYTFIFDRRTDKFIIKQVIEYFFKTQVLKINTLRLSRKKRSIGHFLGYQPKYKKSVITLKDGAIINLFFDI